jgi:hypothetical protein
MTRGGFVFLLFCAGVLWLFVLAGRYAWSPFADGGPRMFATGARGPTHK